MRERERERETERERADERNDGKTLLGMVALVSFSGVVFAREREEDDDDDDDDEWETLFENTRFCKCAFDVIEF